MIEPSAAQAKVLAPASRAGVWRRDRGWLLTAVVLLVMIAALVLLWPTTASLGTTWQASSNSTYGHGYLIMAISCWLILRNHRSLSELAPRPSVLAAMLILPVSLVWLMALRASIETAHQLLLPILLWLTIYAALGRQVALRCVFPVGYLYFALPIWDLINGLLQTATVMAVELLLRLTHVNAYVQGNFVHLASGVFEIAGGCSGLHFFIVALSLAVLYGEINYDTLRVRIKLVVMAAGLALLTNWIRVYTIILAGYLTDMKHYLVRVEHYQYGWVLFALAMAVFFIVARRLPVSDVSVAPNAPATVLGGDVIVTTSALSKGVLLACFAVALVPAWSLIVPVRAAVAPAQTALLPQQPGSWLGPRPATNGSWRPVFIGADVTAQGDYVNGGQRASVYTAVYLSQQQGHELIGYHNSVAGERATIASQARIGGPIPSVEMVVEQAAGSAVIRYFYQVGARVMNRGVVAELAYGWQALASTPISRVVAMRTECAPDCVSARATLAALMNDISQDASFTYSDGNR